LFYILVIYYNINHFSLKLIEDELKNLSIDCTL